VDDELMRLCAVGKPFVSPTVGAALLFRLGEVATATGIAGFRAVFDD
jgi:hypothetical protein